MPCGINAWLVCSSTKPSAADGRIRIQHPSGTSSGPSRLPADRGRINPPSLYAPTRTVRRSIRYAPQRPFLPFNTIRGPVPSRTVIVFRKPIRSELTATCSPFAEIPQAPGPSAPHIKKVSGTILPETLFNPSAYDLPQDSGHPQSLYGDRGLPQ